MEPLFQCIYPDCNKLFDLPIEMFCPAYGRLSRCPHEDCRSVFDSEIAC